MLRLKDHGIDAVYVTLEQIFSQKVSAWIRKYFLNVYFAHVPFFFAFFRYDIVFSSTAFGSQLLRSLVPFRKPKWVMFDFSITGLLGRGKTLRQKLFKWMVLRSAGIVTISEKEKEMLHVVLPGYKGQIEYIPYGVDTEYFKPQQVQELHQVITVGFDYGRDYATLFAAFENLEVALVATTNMRSDSFNEKPDFVTTASFSPEALLMAYAESKIVVLPLTLKGRGNDAMGCSTLVEAMAMGKAVIATRTFTTESYITNGVDGILVEEGDIQGMKAAIQKLVSDDEYRKRLGEEARRFILATCTAELFASRLAAFFKRV
jgi:glycosyltransferase involved in cell wall biosynthesis